MSRSSFRESGAEERERRTIIVERSAGSFGFTLQSYGIHYRDENDVEVITYVDYVDPLGQAHRAGLRSGDVILSINGQDVERADHSTLVSIIQTCPNRIRMVVLFENCVRKVELHMKYIRLQQILEQKAREYQEVCAREKSLLSKLNRVRVPGGYQTMHFMSNVKENPSLNCVGSSKSMPRSYSNHSAANNDCITRREGFDPARGGCTKKNSSYLCISRSGADCDCCFHQLEESKKGVKFKSKTGDSHQPNAQRPRSFHISSCYKDTARHTDNGYYKSQDWTAKAYGGYGFGYDFNVSTNPERILHSRRTGEHSIAASSSSRLGDRHGETSLTNPSYYRRSLPKSADDLLAAQFENQCQLSPLQVRRGSKSGRQSVSQQPSLDSISFYTRPPQPRIATTDELEHVTSLPAHYQLPQSQIRTSLMQQSQRPPPRPAKASKASRGGQQRPGVASNPHDEGGFDEERPFRTLPLVSKRNTEYY